ncbi:MAG TPA: rubrerythrin family protein, partial [Armatimonadota bacterium]|nr:rubrerythrin family protein [Armatimonadota bacterium]
KMTEDNAKAAFAGESQAHVKYLVFSEKAKQEGKPNVARLFAAASYAEQVHAAQHLRVMKGIGSTAENLTAAVSGEGFEIDEMYPAYLSVAEAQSEPAAKTSFQRAFEAEKVHKELYQQAKEAVEAGKDVELGDILVCPTCGFTTEGTVPEKCPLCGVGSDRFIKF